MTAWNEIYGRGHLNDGMATSPPSSESAQLTAGAFLIPRGFYGVLEDFGRFFGGEFYGGAYGLAGLHGYVFVVPDGAARGRGGRRRLGGFVPQGAYQRVFEKFAERDAKLGGFRLGIEVDVLAYLGEELSRGLGILFSRHWLYSMPVRRQSARQPIY